MDKKIGPDSNRFKEINEDIAEENETIPEEETPEEIEAEIKKEEELAKEQFRSRIVKMMVIVIIVIVIIVLIGFIISLTSKKNYSYSETEDVMKEAAESYFSDNKDKLPSGISQKVSIEDSILSNKGYMKTLDKYLGTNNCEGKVIVQKTNKNSYSYTSYLDCGTSYQTAELYKKLTDKKNIVSEGYGLYQYNGGYVYRGKEVNNYVKFEDSDIIWRVLKINTSNEITLIQSDTTVNSFVWDDRYNRSFEENLGINTYSGSTVSSILNKLYNNKLDDDNDSSYYEEESTIFTKKIKSKLLKFKVCVGKRSETDTSKDGSAECSEIEESKVSLLPVYDFLNVSLDPNCTTTISPDCQNYNYLADGTNFWLANGSLENSARVYIVSSQGYINDLDANNEQRLKLVIRVGNNVMLEKGKGTKKNPYIIR